MTEFLHQRTRRRLSSVALCSWLFLLSLPGWLASTTLEVRSQLCGRGFEMLSLGVGGLGRRQGRHPSTGWRELGGNGYSIIDLSL